MSDAHEPPSRGSFWLSFLGVTGSFLVFAIILWSAYLPRRLSLSEKLPNLTPEERAHFEALTDVQREDFLARIPANVTKEQRYELNLLLPGERKERLDELRNREAAVLGAYTWIDREKGVVHLPLRRAVDLTVRDLREKQKSVTH